MRITSRATWVNPLSWPKDERRAEFVPLLHQLTQGKIFSAATATETANPDVWQICAKVRFPPDWSSEVDWCTTTDNPQPPVPPGPGPPPPGYPGDFEDLTITIFPEEGTLSCWLIFPPDPTEFFPNGGVWGSWGNWFTGQGVGDLWLEVYAVSWTPGVVEWQLDWEVSGGGSGSKTATVAAGFTPLFVFLPGELPDCPAVRLAVDTVIPP